MAENVAAALDSILKLKFFLYGFDLREVTDQLSPHFFHIQHTYTINLHPLSINPHFHDFILFDKFTIV